MKNYRRTGFTTVELLTVLAIIAMLIGVLLPALSAVRKAAKEAKQKAQLMTIDLALVAFKNDYGDYPPSSAEYRVPGPGYVFDYCGSQKLSEALLGWDLLGFHPKSAWRADGCDPAGNPVYSPTDPNLRQRKGPYLELATANAFRLGNISVDKPGLFNNTNPLAPDTYVICDVFGVKRITLAPGKTAIAGTPILYYKADTSSKNIDNPDFFKRIYNVLDNAYLLLIKEQEDRIKHPNPSRWPLNPLFADTGNFQFFYNYIKDPKITILWPYRPDSYILISAGADGFYGTEDDIRNFGY